MAIKTYHRNGSTEGADTQSTDESPDCKLVPLACTRQLDDDTDNEDAAFYYHGVSPTKVVRSAVSHVSHELEMTYTARYTHGAPHRAPIKVPILKNDTTKPLLTLLQ